MVVTLNKIYILNAARLTHLFAQCINNETFIIAWCAGFSLSWENLFFMTVYGKLWHTYLFCNLPLKNINAARTFSFYIFEPYAFNRYESQLNLFAERKRND